MAPAIELTFDTDGTVTKSEVRDALSGLTEDDLSNSSPVSPGGEDIAIVETPEVVGDEQVVVRASGDAEEFTKTSTGAIIDRKSVV